MNFIPLISSPLSEAWTAWVLLSYLLFLIIVELHQPGQIMGAMRELTSKLERNYNDVGEDIFTITLLYLFRFGIFGLMLYMLFYTGDKFAFGTYAAIVGIVAAVEAVRSAIFVAIHFAFGFRSNLQTFFHQYNRLWLLLCLMLYPICVIMMNIGPHPALKIACIVALAAYFIGLIWKIIRIAPFRVVHILYIVLYLFLLEVIPLGVTMIAVRGLLNA